MLVVVFPQKFPDAFRDFFTLHFISIENNFAKMSKNSGKKNAR